MQIWIKFVRIYSIPYLTVIIIDDDWHWGELNSFFCFSPILPFYNHHSRLEKRQGGQTHRHRGYTASTRYPSRSSSCFLLVQQASCNSERIEHAKGAQSGAQYCGFIMVDSLRWTHYDWLETVWVKELIKARVGTGNTPSQPVTNLCPPTSSSTI